MLSFARENGPRLGRIAALDNINEVTGRSLSVVLQKAPSYVTVGDRAGYSMIRITWVANSTVEYSAFNRLVPGSNPGRPIFWVTGFAWQTTGSLGKITCRYPRRVRIS